MKHAARWSVYALAALFALEWRTPLLKVGPVGFTTTECLITVMTGLWLASFITERRLPRRPSPHIWVPLLVWVGVMALSVVAAPADRWNAALFVARTSAGVVVGWAAFDLLDAPEYHRRALIALACGGLIVAAAGLAEATQHPLALSVLSGFKVAPTRVGDLLRVSGVLSYATIMAVILEVILLTTLGLFLSAERRIPWAVALGIMAVALLLTLSRAGVIAAVVGAATLGLMGALRGERRILIGAGGFAALTVVAVGVLFALNPTTLLRLQSETEQEWYQVNKSAPAQAAARPGETITVPVTIHNQGVRSWEPSEGFMLGYHLHEAEGDTITYDGARTPLPHAVNPDETLTLDAAVTAPTDPGVYTVEWDMVHEAVTWFSWKDAPTVKTLITVTGEPVPNALPISTVPPPTDQAVTPGRLELWPVAWAMFIDRPLLGVGPDNFRFRYGDYTGLETWNTAIHANNLYLELLADTGLPGFAAFLWFSGALIVTMARVLWKSPTSERWLLLLGCGAALIAWYTHGFVDFFYAFTPTYTLYWLVVGCALGLMRGVSDAHRV